METNKTVEFKNKLRSIREKLFGDVEKNLKSGKEEISQNIPDISDEAARDYNNELRLNLDQQDREKLKLVEEALDRINSGDYGVCPECETEIPEARLKVVPYAHHCVKCLETIEKDTSLTKHSASRVF
tara:strand:- start:817 stop:1200 length:384 start_codon:yes stop_codon:yes gene_type:complete